MMAFAMVFSCAFMLILLAGFSVGPILLLVGLIGQRDASRPRCRACKRPLADRAVFPAACPACAAALSSPKTVGFGGWRLRWRPLILGILLTLGATGVAIAISMPLALYSSQNVDGVMIERRMSESVFAERTAELNESSRPWIRAHLRSETLSPEFERRAAALLLESIAAGDDLAESVLALEAVPDAFEREELANAIFTALAARAPPTVRFAVAGDEVRIECVPSPLATQLLWAGPRRLRVGPYAAIVEVRADGTPLRASRPGGRGGALSAALTAHFEDPDQRAATAERLEVELIWLDFGESVPEFELGLPGPPDLWPEAIASRRVVLVATATP